MNETKNTSNKIAFVILAAGESRRMGEIKQLLMWQEKSFIKHSVEKALACCPNDVYVVLGANSDKIATTLKNENVNFIYNSNWKKGLGSSISEAIRYLEKKQSNYSGVLISLVDQPLIPITHYENLLSYFKPESKGIIASKFDNNLGVPAIFSKSYYSELIKLSENQGAKKIIASNKKDVNSMVYEGNYSDIDTEEDYLDFLKKYS